MATGITKREQHSPDAISALDFGEEPIPLPDERATVTLNYPNKASVEDISQHFPRRFVKIENKAEHSLEEIPDNAFILGDNFFVLSKLLVRGRRRHYSILIRRMRQVLTSIPGT